MHAVAPVARALYWITTLMLGLAVATPALAIDATLTIKTTALGAFPGENVDPGREDTISILGYADRSYTPLDPLTGLPAGSPRCGPLVIRKLVDRTTPLFAQAWNTNDQTTQFVLLFYSAGAAYFKIELTSALITSISRAGAENDGVPSEQITLIFQSVSYEHLASGLSSQVNCFGGGSS